MLPHTKYRTHIIIKKIYTMSFVQVRTLLFLYCHLTGVLHMCSLDTGTDHILLGRRIPQTFPFFCMKIIWMPIM